MAFDKMIVKKLLKKFDDVPFVVKFPDGEEFKVGEGEPQAIIRANGGIDMGAVMKSPDKYAQTSHLSQQSTFFQAVYK